MAYITVDLNQRLSPHTDCALSPEAYIVPEIELRLAVRAADLPRLRRALEAMAPDAKVEQAQLVSIYYDTADRALARRGWVLRVRQRDGHFVQTVKSTGLAGETLLARGEWEDPVASEHPDPQAGNSGRFLTPDVADRLNPLFQTEVTRLVTDLSPAPGICIEAAIDRGGICAPGGGPIERISEIALELKSGSDGGRRRKPPKALSVNLRRNGTNCASPSRSCATPANCSAVSTVRARSANSPSA